MACEDQRSDLPVHDHTAVLPSHIWPALAYLCFPSLWAEPQDVLKAMRILQYGSAGGGKYRHGTTLFASTLYIPYAKPGQKVTD